MVMLFFINEIQIKDDVILNLEIDLFLYKQRGKCIIINIL